MYENVHHKVAHTAGNKVTLDHDDANRVDALVVMLIAATAKTDSVVDAPNSAA